MRVTKRVLVNSHPFPIINGCFCYREAKRDKGNKYAKENGHPELVNVLQPRTRGFVACLSELRGSLDSGKNVTAALKEMESFTVLPISFVYDSKLSCEWCMPFLLTVTKMFLLIVQFMTSL